MNVSKPLSVGLERLPQEEVRGTWERKIKLIFPTQGEAQSSQKYSSQLHIGGDIQ